MPEIVIVLLKLVMPFMLDETVRVSVAAVDCPACNVSPCLFQVTATYAAALGGVQLVTVMLRVIGAVPVFFT